MLNIHPSTLAAIAYADHGSPEDVLGAHAHDNKTLIRTMRPYSQSVAVILENGSVVPMERVHESGIFEAVVEQPVGFIYHYSAVNYDGHQEIFHESYGMPSFFGEMDFYLMGEGRHWQLYDKMGAHLREINGVVGVNFAVWAPNARRVSVVGNFNRWDGRIHLMQQRQDTGVWELFIPGVAAGDIYKYEIRSHNKGYQAQKIDPYGFAFEVRPNTASVVANIDTYTWEDSVWMEQRAQTNWHAKPIAIYELHLGSWQRKADGKWLSYRELATTLIPYVREMGYTHIELMPVAEHPFDGSWGYQVTGYYAPTSRYGSPQDFMYFVDQCHQQGIGVILDWVPAHFPKDGHALSYFDGTHLYSHADPRQGEHPDWGTYIFNYGRNEVRNFLVANALFWLKKYHIDGLRVDAVSSMLYLDFSRKAGEWIPNRYGGNDNLEAIAFLKETNQIIRTEAPGTLMIAEESTAWAKVSYDVEQGGLGFHLKWNMGWMHDTLKYMQQDPVYRRYSHNMMTFSMLYAYTENFVLSLSHDEVVHGKGSIINKMPGDWWHKFASARLLLGYQYAHVGKKLNFMGHEIGQWAEWSEARALDWHLLDLPTHQGMKRWVRDVNHLYQASAALFELDFDGAGFRWIEPNDADSSVFSFIRFARNADDFIVVIANFTPIPREAYRIGVPKAGTYHEVLNSDRVEYGGSGIQNAPRYTEVFPWHGFEQSLSLTVPPLAILLLRLGV